MTPNEFIKMFETVGIPVLTAASAGYALWWLIRWITGSFKQELKDEHQDITKSIDILNIIMRQVSTNFTNSRIDIENLFDFLNGAGRNKYNESLSK